MLTASDNDNTDGTQVASPSGAVTDMPREGQNLLNDAAARQDRWRAQNGGYITSTDDVDKLKLAHGNRSENGHYTLTLGTVADAGGYTLTATRTGTEASDRKCGDFTLNGRGAKGTAQNTPGTAAQCWR